jgi:hypothetical protein
LSSDRPVTAFSSIQYPFAAYLLGSFPVFLSAFTGVSASGFCFSEEKYQGFGFQQCFVFVTSFRGRPLQILAGCLSLPKL